MSRKLMSLESIESRTLRSASPAPATEWANYDLNYDGQITSADIMVADSGDYNLDGEVTDSDVMVSDSLGGVDTVYATLNLAANVGFQWDSPFAAPHSETNPLDFNLDGSVTDADIAIVDSGDLNLDDESYGFGDLMIADSHGGWENLYNELYAATAKPEHVASTEFDFNQNGDFDNGDVMIVDSGDLNCDGLIDTGDILIADTFGGLEALQKSVYSKI